jgi:hypothetical protein
VSRKRVYDDGRIRYHCGPCSLLVSSIEEAFGRRVEVYKAPDPWLAALGRQIADHALAELLRPYLRADRAEVDAWDAAGAGVVPVADRRTVDDPADVAAWLEGLARVAAEGLFHAAGTNGQADGPS